MELVENNNTQCVNGRLVLGACSCCHVAWNKYIEVSEFRVFWGLGVSGFGSERDDVNFWGVKCINKLKLNFT